MSEMSNGRRAELAKILADRRRQMQTEVQTRIRDARTDRASEVLDEVENSGSGMQEDIEFALIQVKAQTLSRIEEALVKLEAGTYGYCVECGEEVSEQRLRALPFAVRCKACEEKREQGDAQARRISDSRGASLFSDVGRY